MTCSARIFSQEPRLSGVLRVKIFSIISYEDTSQRSCNSRSCFTAPTSGPMRQHARSMQFHAYKVFFVHFQRHFKTQIHYLSNVFEDPLSEITISCMEYPLLSNESAWIRKTSSVGGLELSTQAIAQEPSHQRGIRYQSRSLIQGTVVSLPLSQLILSLHHILHAKESTQTTVASFPTHPLLLPIMSLGFRCSSSSRASLALLLDALTFSSRRTSRC